jgi:hypothetical protein
MGAVLAIVSALQQEPLLREQRVRIKDRNASIVLSGTLPTSAARDRLLEVAEAHGRGLPIVDSLVVAPDAGPRQRPGSARADGGSR